MIQKGLSFELIDRIKSNSEVILREGISFEKNSNKIGYLCGYVTEMLFLKKYERDFQGYKYSTDWWVFIPRYPNFKDDKGKLIEGIPYFVVFKDFEDLNSVDKKMIRNLRDSTLGKKCECMLVMIEGNELYVYKLDYKNGKEEREFRYSIKFTEEKINSYKNEKLKRWLSNKSSDKMPRNEISAYSKAIKFMKREGVLEKKALEYFKIYVFLTYNGFTEASLKANIDVIGEDKNGIPIYYEVKFKASKQLPTIAIKRFQIEKVAEIFSEKKMFAKNVILCNDFNNSFSTVDDDKKWELQFNLIEKQSIDQLSWKVLDIQKVKGYTKRYDKSTKFVDDPVNYTHIVYPIDKYESFKNL